MKIKVLKLNFKWEEIMTPYNSKIKIYGYLDNRYGSWGWLRYKKK